MQDDTTGSSAYNDEFLIDDTQVDQEDADLLTVDITVSELQQMNCAAPAFVPRVHVAEQRNGDIMPTPMLACAQCDFQSDSQETLDTHTSTCDPLAQLTCTLCGVQFTSANLLTTHINTTHKRNFCNLCEFNSVLEADLDLHVKTHQKFPCEQCLSLIHI